MAPTYAVPLSWYLILSAILFCARCRRVSLPAQHHHRLHVDRADAQRGEPELHHVFVQMASTWTAIFSPFS